MIGVQDMDDKGEACINIASAARKGVGVGSWDLLEAA
jgi:hypothetical protein